MNRPIVVYWIPGNICVMNADGSNRVQLTDNQGWESDPAWSPDSSKVAFSSDRQPGVGGDHIHVMNADGTELTQITHGESDDKDPSWSPDGSMIAFSSRRYGNRDIFVVNSDGSELRRITDSLHDEYDPVWSPDGSRIAFALGTEDESDLYMIDPDGDGESLLLVGSGRSPAWSPDGETIAFTSNVYTYAGDRLLGETREIFVINVDDSEIAHVTHRRRNYWHPTWSPDGSKLVFASAVYAYDGDRLQYRTREIFVIQVER